MNEEDSQLSIHNDDEKEHIDHSKKSDHKFKQQQQHVLINLTKKKSVTFLYGFFPLFLYFFVFFAWFVYNAKHGVFCIVYTN